MSKLRWKLVAIVLVFLVFGAVGIYPILAARWGINSPSWLMDKQLKLGLDLKGGVHLVIRVETAYALRLESEQEMEHLQQELTKRGVADVRITLPDATHFRVEGVPLTQDAAFRQAATEVQANFDRSSGANGTYVFAMKPNVQVQLRQDAVVQARETIERRVNELGVSEPSIAQQGQNGDEIAVQPRCSISGSVTKGWERISGWRSGFCEGTSRAASLPSRCSWPASSSQASSGTASSDSGRPT